MPQIKVTAQTGCSGYFVISTDKRGELARFPNLITNAGLDRMAENQDWMTWCQVGSGSTAPAVTDGAMANRIAGTSTLGVNVSGSQSSAPYFTWRRNTYRFAQGVATGNLSEVGIGWLSAGGLLSRALILDGGGLPTTITIQADESLDVTYEFRMYPKVTDNTGSVTLGGNIGGVYNWTFRAANVTSNTAASWSIAIFGTRMNRAPDNGSFIFFTNGAIAAVTGQPSGTTGASAFSVAAYSAGSYQLAFTMTAGLSDSNLAGGISACYLSTGIPAFQIGFSPSIPKTSNDILSLVFTHSWGRRP
jgi:hypothetical protein